ncbi:MAG TPA: imidazole glycerol phosphate synthase subunit HisH [Candidatus Mcinerneyibacteriales bacterium]|nr:imidazole glycerol phosphate synthase subunit HisH [Candidatus Mcinerneyibacteriales bacterium]
MVGIIDYGAGNLYSVQKAFAYLGITSSLVTQAGGLDHVNAVILPGVGAFGEAAHRLEITGLNTGLERWIGENRPFLGICLGMQLLASSSEESPSAQGLGVIQGGCRPVQGTRRIHMGWNRVSHQPDLLFYGIPEKESYFYFVHGYALPAHTEGVIAVSEYGAPFAAAFRAGDLCGVQFHPEKSGKNGLRFLENWRKTWDV